MKPKRPYISAFILVLVTFVTLISSLQSGKWQEQKIIIFDGKIYYSYLPALFIYHDLTFDRSEELISIFGKNWKNTAPNGNKVVKMTMGNAVCWLPFFWAGHLAATLGEHQADGFSPPYHLAIQLSGIFYLFLGLFFLRKLLLRYFDDTTTAITLAIIALGTNLYYYAAYEPFMSHVNSFCMITIFFYFSLKWFDEKTTANSLMTGLSLGLVMLIRPTNFIAGVIPLLMWFTLYKSWQEKWFFIKENYKTVLVIIVTALAVFSPQMIYWQIQSGSIIYNSYHEEGFFFNDPEIIGGLFSYRKGWLLYTPLMALSIIGLFFMKDRLAELRWPIIVFFIVFIYIIFSWWTWWYGASFSSRPLIDIYGILAVPLAASVAMVLKFKWWLRLPVSLIIAFLIYLNLFQTTQYRLSMIHWDGMTREAYWTIFLEKKWPENYTKMFERPDYEKAIRGTD